MFCVYGHVHIYMCVYYVYVCVYACVCALITHPNSVCGPLSKTNRQKGKGGGFNGLLEVVVGGRSSVPPGPAPPPVPGSLLTGCDKGWATLLAVTPQLRLKYKVFRT